MLYRKLDKKLYYTLRVAIAMCFIGHGCFGIITKPIWCNYFAIVGISHHLSYQLMPVLGCFDVLLGIIMLAYPVSAIPAWLVLWGLVTALLRPLSGEPFAEFIERAGNYGVPLSFLLLTGLPKNFRSLFTRLEPASKVDAAIITRVTTCLKIVVFFLLAGHGWLNLIGKEALLKQYTSIGISNPVQIAGMIGSAEIAAALVVLVKPLRSLLFAFFIWKVVSELMYPHYEFFEWIERGGSYGALLALWLTGENSSVFKRNSVAGYFKPDKF